MDCEYTYTPRPWPLGVPFPNRELWYYFMRPEDCGSSNALNEMLPMRTGAPSASRITAFGVHIVEKHSIITLCIPPFVLFLFTIGATLWFVPEWLRTHPGDLQNATIPIIAALTVVMFPVQLFTSALILRWSGSER